MTASRAPECTADPVAAKLLNDSERLLLALYHEAADEPQSIAHGLASERLEDAYTDLLRHGLITTAGSDGFHLAIDGISAGTRLDRMWRHGVAALAS